ncbi:type II toxin-antitoxin system prevent-host-death family antitoxin [Aquisalimonas sp.]|uniref:type II toxin-antitoxin system Phd/YefM family antitoxin n=1 Tax=Aquisalimonas sp. TaxID=1872621 RepID=UPI0025B92944|nr:type II toxin-antitoxin system prevent-host-death family antitoxin [Aquisalimonas sp.]
MQVNIHEAKTRLSQLVERALGGERIVIAKAGTPCLELVPYRGERGERRPGRLKGRIWMAPDFDNTPDDVIDDFEGRSG